MEQRTIDVEKAIKAQRDYLIERSKTDKTWMRDSFARGEGFAPKTGYVTIVTSRYIQTLRLKGGIGTLVRLRM